MRIGIIGAGKVGFTIGKYFSTHGLTVTGYYSRRAASSEEAARFTGSRNFSDMNELVRESDVLFLTVPDGSITAVYREMDPALIRGKYIGHMSGSLSSEDAFPKVKETGASAFSVHPLFAVSDRYHAYERLPDVFFAAEGDEEALQVVVPMLEGIGLHLQEISPASKARYHLAAAAASNLVNALLLMSIQLLTECGFSEEGARAALAPLAEGNLQHVMEHGVVDSLTGPVERADAETIQKHLACLSGARRQIYCLLSEMLVPAAREKNPERDYSSIINLLRRVETTPAEQCSTERMDEE